LQGFRGVSPGIPLAFRKVYMIYGVNSLFGLASIGRTSTFRASPLGAADFGVISSARPPRTVQLGARFHF
jgi:hypothetical protein